MDAQLIQQLVADGGALALIAYMVLRNTRTTYQTIPRIVKEFKEALKQQDERHQKAAQDQRSDFKEELKAEREQTNKVISRIPKAPY